MAKEENGIFIDYNEIAQHLFEELVSSGYAPGEDELLDIADIVMDLIIHYHTLFGGTVEMIVSMEDESEEEE